MDLRLTDTNAASDSKGQTWGLEGNLFWWLVGGIGAGIILFFVLIIVVNAGFMTAFGVAVVPVLLCLAYIFGLRQGKPPGYDRDCLEYWLSGAGFSPAVTAGGCNPLFGPESAVLPADADRGAPGGGTWPTSDAWANDEGVGQLRSPQAEERGE